MPLPKSEMKFSENSRVFNESDLPDLRELAEGDEPLPHSPPTWEQYVAHTRMLLQWSAGRRESLHPPRQEEPFRLD